MPEKKDDYLAAKAAWEKDHPDELYSTARHNMSGPSARVLRGGYSETAPPNCDVCGWKGLNRDGDKELFSELFDVSCPNCGKMLLVVGY